MTFLAPLTWTAKDLLMLKQTVNCTYISASSRKQELETCIQIAERMALWVLVNPVCANEELHSKHTVCFEYTTTKHKTMVCILYFANNIISLVK